MRHRQILLDLLGSVQLTAFRNKPLESGKIFEKIFGYERIKRTFLRSLNSEEPVHILLVGPPGHSNTTWLLDYGFIWHQIPLDTNIYMTECNNIRRIK